MRFVILCFWLVFRLLPLFENDFVLAKMLPICTVLNNTAMTVAIANADVLWFFAMVLTVWFSPPAS
jgi:hypothetical protein